jgi:hypothetical protein
MNLEYLCMDDINEFIYINDWFYDDEDSSSIDDRDLDPDYIPDPYDSSNESSDDDD